MPISGGASISADEIWDYLTSGMVAGGSIGLLSAESLVAIPAIVTNWKYEPSDDLLASNDALSQEDNDAWILMPGKTIAYAPTPGAQLKESELRIKYEMRSNTNGEMAHTEIRRDAVAVGTERQNDTTTWEEYTEDISGWNTGEAINIYGKHPAAGIGTTEVKNFRVYGVATRHLDPGLTW